jgi:transglutaminase superfamily protein
VSVTRSDPLAAPAAKLAVAVRTIALYVKVRRRLRRRTIPQVAAEARGWVVSVPAARPERLGRLVTRVLAIGPWRARCLHTSFVLFAMLRGRGEPAILVIGLPERPETKEAHAWVELEGRDVGPPPGRGTHVELARYS